MRLILTKRAYGGKAYDLVKGKKNGKVNKRASNRN